MALAITLIGPMTRIAWRNARAREAAQHRLEKARQQTAQREQELSILFKSVKELIFRTDAQGAIRFVNPRWHQLTGEPPAAAQGKRLCDVVEPQSAPVVAALFQAGRSTGWRRGRDSLRGLNGKARVLEITVMPLTHSDGQLYGYAGSAVDITALHGAQKKLQHQLALTERVLEGNPLPLCLTDMQGRFITVNAAWESFMGVPRSHALGRLNRDILPAAQAQAYDAHTEQLLREGGTVRYEERVPRTDGSVRDVQITKVLLHSAQGEPMGVLINKLDITDFLAARHQAQEASRTKSEFVANISHELRTPLQSILGFSELGMVRARQHEKYAAMFGDIHAAGQRMLGLINDLLDLSKIESTVGAFHFARNDVRDLLEDVAAELQVLLERKGLALRLELGRTPLVSKVDPTRFAQVVRNILSNAVKFSPEGSAIEISAGTPDESTILVQVRDHGPGIPPAELETVFDAFVQSSKTRDESGGTGLGLAICRKIVTAHGGHIHATNAPGGGTIFHITLPTAIYTDTMPSPLV
jgi:PAS domain S-box-containing protein